jgi:hypothetical protein
LTLHIYADESGDLGWRFDAPYGQKGSSRYLTIFAVCVEDNHRHRLDRVVRGLYTASRWNTKHERKWIDANEKSRTHFAQEAAKLATNHPHISYRAIVVYKPNVQAHLREDPNKLYNFMLKLLLLRVMAKHQMVCFFPDNRSVKVANGNALQDYLQTCLWGDEGVATQLHTVPTDSKGCRELQFADMMAGIVGTKFENKKTAHFDTVAAHVMVKRLFF